MAKSKLPKSLTTVTWFSKLIAIIIFFLLLIGMFYAGMQYQSMQDQIKNPEKYLDYSNMDKDDMIMCTQEAKQCSDGSYVSRTGPNCEFEACPN